VGSDSKVELVAALSTGYDRNPLTASGAISIAITFFIVIVIFDHGIAVIAVSFISVEAARRTHVADQSSHSKADYIEIMMTKVPR
jgi:sterol desaturase/sphingolipid hydroxylase (fatty acid hydroxylase superfamily)